MDIEAVYEMVTNDLEAVEEELERNIQSEVALIPTLGKHILNSGGKRFRPLILILSARFCGYQGNEHIALAGILEFIHTATLLHDDVVDNAKIRRGNVSAHTIWGNQASILIGDFFFAQSFSLISQTQNWRLLKVLTEATSKLAKGEILDLVKERDTSCTEEDYLAIVIHKTASLIEAASHMGGILGEVNDEDEMAMKLFGYHVGIAFQCMDDTLDYIATQEELGKDIGKDLQEGKITLPLIHALEKASPAEKQKVVSALEQEKLEEQALEDILTLINRYEGIEYSIQKAKDHAQQGKHILNGLFSPSPEKEALLAVADYVIERRS
jgi:octaprenyl-diphosphate synthase